MLEYINIDGTNLVSSRIALDTWAIGGWMWGGSDEKDRFAPFVPRSPRFFARVFAFQ
ncbi:MAG: hypothetical protein WA857_04745 [Candidatus Acidiferrum sp.]